MLRRKPGPRRLHIMGQRHAKRLPKGMKPIRPGELVQIDTLFVNAEFADACRERNLCLFVLPPKRPQLNGHVELAQGSWRYEFYGVEDLPSRLKPLQLRIDAFAHRFKASPSPWRSHPSRVPLIINHQPGDRPVSYGLSSDTALKSLTAAGSAAGRRRAQPGNLRSQC